MRSEQILLHSNEIKGRYVHMGSRQRQKALLWPVSSLKKKERPHNIHPCVRINLHDPVMPRCKKKKRAIATRNRTAVCVVV